MGRINQLSFANAAVAMATVAPPRWLSAVGPLARAVSIPGGAVVPAATAVAPAYRVLLLDRAPQTLSTPPPEHCF